MPKKNSRAELIREPKVSAQTAKFFWQGKILFRWEAICQLTLFLSPMILAA